MDPAFPDIVGAWARCQALDECEPANDNLDAGNEDEFLEIFLLEIARREIDATRAW
jgi:hypothetical protein